MPHPLIPASCGRSDPRSHGVINPCDLRARRRRRVFSQWRVSRDKSADTLIGLRGSAR